MEISAETQTELTALLGEIIRGDAQAIDLATCDRRLAGCQRVQALTAAVEAELLPIQRRLLAEAVRSAAAAAATERVHSNGDSAQGEPDDHTNNADPAGEPTIGAGEPTDRAGDEPPAEPPRPRPRESARARQQRELRSKWLEFYPALNAALAAGTITAEHVDALAQVFERTAPIVIAEFDEPWLVSMAETYPPEGFASFLRDEINRIRDDGGEAEHARQINDSWAWIGLDKPSGMYLLKLAVDPLRGPQLQSAVLQRMAQLRNTPGTDKLRYSQLCLQAVLDLMLGDVQVVPESLVVVDHHTATTGRQHPNTVCENIDGIPLPISVALNACATGNVTAAVIDTTGKIIDYGCSSPLADKQQRILQRGMYRSCAHPDCTVPYSRCEIHHVIYRQHDGKTVMSNLVPLCFHHHHELHDDHWTLTMDAERTLRWYRPDGTPAHEVPLRRLDNRNTGDPPPHHTGPPDQPPDHPDAATRAGPPGPPLDQGDAPPGDRQPGGGPPDEPPQLFDPHAA